MGRRLASTALAITVIVSSGSAAAGSIDTPAKPKATWYGGQTLAVDLTGIGALVAIAVAGLSACGLECSPRSGWSIASGIVVGAMIAVPPLIHASHQSGAAPWISLGMRAATLGIAVAGGLADKPALTTLGAVGFHFVAAPIDHAALAYERGSLKGPDTLSIGAMPLRQGAALTVGGAF